MSVPLLNYLQNSLSHTLGDTSLSGMFGNMVKSFMRQVVITGAHNIYNEILKKFWNNYLAWLAYRTKIWTKITQDKKSRAGWTEKKKRALLTQTKKNSGKKFCADNFFVWTIFLSGQKGIYHQVEFHSSFLNIHIHFFGCLTKKYLSPFHYITGFFRMVI